MTESQWLSCSDPSQMLKFVRDVPGDRILRLFACACCRRIWPLLAGPRSRQAVEMAERFADRKAEEKTLEACGTAAWMVHRETQVNDRQNCWETAIESA